MDVTRAYQTHLTASENNKGVLDLDTVKGCTMGMRAHPDGGCYGCCYANKLATFRGLDFTRSVSRYPQSQAELQATIREVRRSPARFVRIGTMGDPCHDWPGTVRTAWWLSQVKPVVIITKHWLPLPDEWVRRLVGIPVTLNTSVSCMDTEAELRHRLAQHYRLRGEGVRSYLRVVTCDWADEATRAHQAELLAIGHTIDNPLRCPGSHPLVTAGRIRVRKVKDLGSEVSMSLWDDSVYVGPCEGLP